MSSIWSRVLVAVAMVCCGTAVLSGQSISQPIPTVNSPYSRFGLGDFDNQSYTAQIGMGGMSAAYSNVYRLNILNPASLSFLEATALEVGLDATYTNLQANGAQETSWGGNLSYLSLGFPLINPINKVLDRKQSPLGLGMAFAIEPYTTVGYNISTTEQNENFGQTSNALLGSGGTYRFSWSNGVKYGPVAGGFTLGMVRGSIINSRQVAFDSLDLALQTVFEDETTLTGFYWRFGLQYIIKLKAKKAGDDRQESRRRLMIGVHGNTINSFNTRSDRLVQRRRATAVDTLVAVEQLEGNGQLPAEFTAGLMYEVQNKLRLGLEGSIANWSQYENEAQAFANLQDTWQLRLGGEYIPNYLSYNNYFERVRYRFGAYYRTDPRQFEGEQLTDYGISLGFGLPVILPRQRTSFIDLALEAGQFGLSEQLQETYMRITLGFTLNDNTWFFKRKFN